MHGGGRVSADQSQNQSPDQHHSGAGRIKISVEPALAEGRTEQRRRDRIRASCSVKVDQVGEDRDRVNSEPVPGEGTVEVCVA